MLWYLFLFINSVYGEFDPDLDLQKLDRTNWTTCEQFIKNSTFHVDKIVDIDWHIFYIWHYVIEETSYNIRFSKPSDMLIDRFRVELQDINTVNWTEAVLFMETGSEVSALFLSTNITHTYRVIPTTAFDMPNCPVMEYALKMVEPGYLAVMSCKDQFAFAMAPVDKMPEKNQIDEAAARFNFHHSMGRSYLTRVTPPPRKSYDDDDIEEDETNVDQHWNTL